jgi:hypothetical protein
MLVLKDHFWHWADLIPSSVIVRRADLHLFRLMLHFDLIRNFAAARHPRRLIFRGIRRLCLRVMGSVVSDRL